MLVAEASLSTLVIEARRSTLTADVSLSILVVDPSRAKLLPLSNPTLAAEASRLQYALPSSLSASTPISSSVLISIINTLVERTLDGAASRTHVGGMLCVLLFSTLLLMV